MPSVIRFAHIGQRRPIIDTLPTPRVSLRVARHDDDLGAARGVLWGTLIGITLWTAIFLAWFIWR